MEFQLRQELREYAVKVRQLAYTLPNGAGEHALLQMSEQMTITADQLALSRPGESEDEDWVC
ncbi:hypothetical protein B8W66_10505 [Mycobacterium decipiens]|uniref:Uncharacterized protein n=1 Tax=Mycobacterium decipiens TaxID=1430326 RepID=A0A1X2LVR7_9MYCO|nr:hypothetical protein B8W66_10505 [Mycobacterium decipiens]